jgi:hypothetical protein
MVRSGRHAAEGSIKRAAPVLISNLCLQVALSLAVALVLSVSLALALSLVLSLSLSRPHLQFVSRGLFLSLCPLSHQAGCPCSHQQCVCAGCGEAHVAVPDQFA